MAVTLFHYPGCGTCKKARKWLDARGVAYQLVDLVASPPPRAELTRLWKRSGLPIRKMFNTSGQSYRAGGFGEKLATMSDEDAIAALAADGKLIKRPILDGGDYVLVGFDEGKYAERVG